MDAGALFDAFISASSFTKIQQLFNQLCALHDIDPYDSTNVYKCLREKVTDWRAKKLWIQLDRRAEQKEYCGQKACTRLNVLVIGAGPCGLRSAIECALLGANVILVEQRDKFSRNNVLHIWPFVIQDLKNLGIKIFYPTFCRGSIDHISIRQLQCVLLKVALVLGVKIHDSVTFKGLIFPEPDKNGKVLGWRANFEPEGHILSEFVFDALIGADGKRNTVPGFPKREMRGKLAIGITANFVNRRTLQEEKVQEISGVAYIFNQQFFKEMKEATGADLENIVYYKDETHYFVMCAKKQSLIEKGVIIEDNEDVSLLLAPSNVDQEKLCEYAASAADFATNGKLPELKYALNHNGKEDVAMFDFTSLFSAQCSVRLVERYDQRLLMAIVGDTLHEPFWPTGSGCARGFLGVLDTAWMLRAYGLNTEGLMLLLAERESAYRLLAQATPDNLHKQLHKYTIDPRTRYISLEMTVQPNEVSHLVDTDNPRNVETNKPLPLRVDSYPTDVDKEFFKKYKLWRFCQQSLLPYKLKMYNFTTCWDDGRPLAALLGKYRPDLIDYISLCSSDDLGDTLKKVIAVVEKEYEIESPCQNLFEWVAMDEEKRVNYIAAIVERFAGDSKRMRDLLINAIRTTAFSHKRKAHQQVDASRAKKSEPIQQRASELLNALSSTSVMPVANVNDRKDRFVDDFLEGRHENFNDEQIREALAELNDDEEKRKERHAKRLKELNERIDFKKFQKQPQGTNVETKHWTKRPQVDKLNPERIYAVEKIVTGEVEAEKTRELYRNKRRQANILTRKMDQRDIDEMEAKLEQTGMGVLFNREQYRVLSSKEEKIMSANAAAARQLARDGFKADDEKYKEIDERLTKAENLLKNQNLAGVDTVSRMRINGALNAPSTDVVLLDAPLCSRIGKPPPPPTPPKRLITISAINEEIHQQDIDHDISFVKLRTEEHTNEARRRPTSMPMMEMSYDSVNARRQHNCRLCSKAVYLAERMQVEGMFIHKKCFRCAFCEQPLRLGHCAQDRNLEKYNPRFYCMQHINVPVMEKIARIEKLDSRASAKADLLKVNPAPNTPSDGTSLESIPPTKSNSPTKLDNGIDKNRSLKVISEVKELNSPAALLGKTIERMRAQREAANVLSMVGGRATGNTPERVEFENFKRNLRADLNARKKEQQRVSECECVSTDDEIDSAVPYRDEVLGSTTSTSEEEDSIGEREHVIDEEVSSSDEDEFMEADLVELEKTVLENIDRNLNETLTDEQAISLLRSFNLRRTSTPQTSKISPEGRSPNTTTFFTPRSTRHSFRSPSADACCSPEGSSSIFRTPLTSRPKASVKGRSESLKSVRERTLVSLADYREKARMRARLKSDEQLGLRHAASGRFSMPVERSTTSRTSHDLRHQLSLNEHSPRNEVIERREPPLVNQMPANDPQTLKTSSSHPSTPTQSDMDTKRDSAPLSPFSPSGRGLLARLFSPDPRRINKQSMQTLEQKNTISAPLATDEIAATSLDVSPASELPTANIESQKETTILERLSSLRKLRHRKLSATNSNEKGTGNGGDDLESDANIAKTTTISAEASMSPRCSSKRNHTHIRSLSQSAQKSRPTARAQVDQTDGSPNSVSSHSSPLSLNEKNIRRIQKRAERIVQQKEQERVRTAQDIQRALQETEIRKAEVNAVGADLERRLKDDSENRWVLEQWLLYVHEMDQLKLRELDLLRRVGEMEAVDEYKRLQKQLNDLQKADSGIERGGSGHTEKDLLKRMLAAIEKRDAIHQQMENSNTRMSRSNFSDPQKLLAEKGASYRNFEPVFLK